MKFDFNSDGETKGSIYQDESVGGDQPHENRPLYYAPAYIMRVK